MICDTFDLFKHPTLRRRARGAKNAIFVLKRTKPCVLFKTNLNCIRSGEILNVSKTLI